jgi:hypothetical protein
MRVDFSQPWLDRSTPKRQVKPRVRRSLFTVTGPVKSDEPETLTYHLGRLSKPLCGAFAQVTEGYGFAMKPLGPNVLKLEDWRLMHESHRCRGCAAKTF